METNHINDIIAHCGEDNSIIRKTFLDMLLDVYIGKQIDFDQISFLHKHNLLNHFRDLYKLLTQNNEADNTIYRFIEQQSKSITIPNMPPIESTLNMTTIETTVPTVRQIDILCSEIHPLELLEFFSTKTPKQFQLFCDNAKTFPPSTAKGKPPMDIIKEIGEQKKTRWCSRDNMRQCSTGLDLFFGR